jgi:predicted CoA-binding protein
MPVRGRLLETQPEIDALLSRTHRVAVLGMKTEAQRGQPAFDVPAYLVAAGLEVVPVPVYYPDVTTILGRPVYRHLTDVPGQLDLVDVFRRPQDIPPHIDDIVAKGPRAIWMQLGIRNDSAAERLLEAGIDVVQDRCLLVDHSAWVARRARGARGSGNFP